MYDGKTNMRGDGMEKRVRIAKLMDIYGAELTRQQAEVLAAIYDEDCSLAEIAERMGISRQAAHDAQKRGAARLEALETLFGIEAGSRRDIEDLRAAREALVEGNTQGALERIDRMIARQEGEDGV